MKKAKNLIDYEHHDDAGMISDYRKDQEQFERDYASAFRREWERHYGSNPDFDPYAEYE